MLQCQFDLYVNQSNKDGASGAMTTVTAVTR
jgi:hypothetical protein